VDAVGGVSDEVAGGDIGDCDVEALFLTGINGILFKNLTLALGRLFAFLL
jgi:hypothetical protein